MEIEFDPSILEPNEQLFYSLLNKDLIWSKDEMLSGFRTVLNGIKVKIDASHVQKRSDGGGLVGLMTGVRSRILEDYWEYELSVAAAPGRSIFGGIKISTGDMSPAVDGLLEDLYWFAYNQHHNQSLENILRVVQNVQS